MNGETRNDRTVHARLLSGVEIVRYDRAGKWFKEWSGRRESIGLLEAVNMALAPGTNVYLNLPGGKLFDANVRRRRGF